MPLPPDGRTISLTAAVSAFLFIAATIAAGAYFVSEFIDKTKLPTIDFSDTVQTDGQQPTDKRPELTVAIAAMISPEVTKHHYEDLLRLIGDRLGMKVVFMQRRTYAEVNALVENRAVDLAFVCSGPYISGNEKFGMEILAVPVVNGVKAYRSYIIAGAESRIGSFADLRGKRFAFTDPDSNTGCLVPRYMLAMQGEALEGYFSETVYTHSHDNSISAVAEGRVDGAAVDSLIWEFFNAVEPGKTRLTKVVGKSPPYGIPPVVVHPNTDKKLKNRFRSVLLNLHKDPEGKALLDQLRIERFDYPDEGAYEEVRRMQEWLAGRER